MLDALFVTSQWIHSDAYSDCDLLTTSHHYLDSSWDFKNKTVHAARPRKHARDPLHNPVAVSEGDSSSTSHTLAHHPVAPPLEQEGHPVPLAVSTPAPASKGAALSDTALETTPQPNPSLQNSIQRLPDPVDQAGLMNQQDNIIEAPPLPILALMTLGEHGASPDFGHLIPPASKDGATPLSALTVTNPAGCGPVDTTMN